ncbi:hypothetical protein AB0M20_25145, partial [Actinoplanes sp. NPDC051633]|uniref:hypothetical protein n=1 Tax=Actinoplanes sp. NPDC051633 TaxID=3155670 RepID=UPI0034143052
MSAPLPGPDTAGYRGLLRRLAGLDAAAAADRAEAVTWHDERVAAADEKVRAADEDVRAAEQAVEAAYREREQIDAEVRGLWATFVADHPRAERFGRTPPDATVPRQRDRAAHEYLEDAAATSRYQPPPRPLSGVTSAMFAAFGFLGGACGVVAHQLLRWAGRAAGGDWAVALPVLALIVMLVGPVLAVFGAKHVRQGVVTREVRAGQVHREGSVPVVQPE